MSEARHFKIGVHTLSRLARQYKLLYMPIAKVMAMVKFRIPPPGLKNPEWISMKLGIYNFVGGVTSHANLCGGATTWVATANT